MPPNVSLRALRASAVHPTPDRSLARSARLGAAHRALQNPHGTAPGQLFERDGKALFLFPGVPHELDHLAAEFLVPWLSRKTGGIARESVTLKLAMRPESEVDQQLEPAYAEFGREWITVLASAGEIKIVLNASGPEAERSESEQAQ